MSGVEHPPLPLLGEPNRVPSLGVGSRSGTVAHGSSRSDAQRDRRRRQVREAQARFRDRQELAAAELRHRTLVLSDALEMIKMENRTLRARLSWYEGVELGPDDALDGIAGTDIVGLVSAAWSGPSVCQTQHRLSLQSNQSLTSGASAWSVADRM